MKKMGLFQYDKLSGLEQQWYEFLKRGIENRESGFVCEDMVEPTWLNRILKAILVDNPQLFWFQGRWRKEQWQGQCCFYLEYTHTEEEISKGKEELSLCAGDFLGKEERSSYELAKYLYDVLREKVCYGMSHSSGQTAYDALVGKAAVCKGLSKAYQLLLQKAGIDCTLAEGTIDGVARHTWNVILIEGVVYHVDVALGYEEFSYLFTGERRFDRYRCFAVTEDIIRQTNQFTEVY